MSPNQSDAVGMLTELVKDCLHQIAALSDKVDDKLSRMEEKITARLDKIEDTNRTNTEKLTAHEHFFGTLKWLAGSGGLLGIVSFLMGWFDKPPSH